ncbi:copper resistance D family protein [Neobacillus bataviensis]|uniref:copper resistance D family protein n=1 Tax=Neobacillus bataviensis TaxID=220685 RepID=UPI001CBCFE4C|nr:CopD family protein [Neobacillus bataviensis]
MSYLIPFTEFGQYILFSLLAGHVVLLFVPENKIPSTFISKPVLLLCTLGIIVCTFAPILQAVLYYKNSFGLLSATVSVITGFQIGRAWIFLCLFSLFLWVTIYVNGSKFFRAQWLLLMIFAIGNAGHAASLAFWPGILAHTIHFLAMTIWVGLLLNVGWFSRDRDKWPNFLRWFTPLAMGCFIIIVISGFFLMFFVMKSGQYLNSWQVPYGRMLLLKHISIIPVLAFAFINGFLSKKSTKLSNFNPRTWLRAESIILMIVFFCTGVLGTLSPPYEVSSGFSTAAKPTWMDWLLAKNIIPFSKVELAPTVPSAILMLISLLFLSLILLSFKKTSVAFAIVFAISFILTIYLGLMYSVTITI